jgi:hypothetical protein
MARKSGLLHGIAINDVNLKTRDVINGIEVMEPAYRMWKDMIKRVYSPKHRGGCYDDASVCDEWLIFSNFKKWHADNSAYGDVLDKDLLVRGNKTYAPDKCLIVTQQVNCFILNNKARRNGSLIGVYWFKRDSRWQAQVSNPFTRKPEYLGYYDDELQGHLAWKRRKHELACQLAKSQRDERVSSALMVRYLGDFTNE